MTEEPKLPYIMPRVTESAFRDLAHLMRGEEDFPRTFGEWQALWDDRRKEEEGNGYNVRFLDILPGAFEKFCNTRKLPASWDTLGQFIAAKAGR